VLPQRIHKLLRSKSLPMMISLMLIITASLQSVHSELEHVGGLAAHCEFCITAQGIDDQLLPSLVLIPAVVADLQPEVLLQIISPSLQTHGIQARAPPIL